MAKRIWTPQGSVRADAPESDYRAAVSSIREHVRAPAFRTSLDQQVAIVFHIKKQAQHLGERDLSLILQDVCDQLDGVSLDRFTSILRLDDAVDIRDALFCTYTEKRPYEQEEDLYPKKGWLGAYLAFARESKAPIAYHFWSGLTILGACCRRNIYLSPGYRLYGNPYLFIIGDSGLGKGTSVSRAEAVLRLANQLFMRELVDNYQAGVGADPPDRRVHVLPKDVTPEALIKQLQPSTTKLPTSDSVESPISMKTEDLAAVLINEELVSLAARHKYAGGGIFHIITALYTMADSPWDRGTIARGTEMVDKLTLSTILGSTLEWINKSISEDMFQGGFMSRSIFCYRTKLDWDPVAAGFDLPPPPDPVLRWALAKTLVPFMLLTPPREVVMDDGARSLWRDIFASSQAKMQEPDDPRMKPYYERKMNHVGKVAIALLASDLVADFSSFNIEVLEARPSFTLRGETLERALRIIEYEEQFLPECFSKIGEHKDSQRIEQLIGLIRREYNKRGGPVPGWLVNKHARTLFGLEAPKVLLVAEGMGMLDKQGVVKNGKGGLVYVPRG